MNLPIKSDSRGELSGDVAIFDDVVLAVRPRDDDGGGHVDSGSAYVLGQAVNARRHDPCWRPKVRTARCRADSSRRRP